MCYNVYMSQEDRVGEITVGVRELRQNLSVYLEQVAAGAVFRVTDRGRPVAMLVPLSAPATTAQRLVVSGRASAPVGDLLALGRPAGHTKKPLSGALHDVREDRL